MLYSKKYCDIENSLKNSFLFTEESLSVMKEAYDKSYENFYCYEAEIIQRISENKDGFFDFNKSLIDIGAATGEYCTNLNFNKIYVFEPCKKLLWVSQANLLNADKEDISYTYQVALSDKEGKESIFTNGLDVRWEVETKTLDSFNIENVGLIKIDVEGFEEKVIRGGLLTIIKNNYPPILFECWYVGYDTICGTMTQEKHDSLFNLLKTLGYEIFEGWGNRDTHLAIHKIQLEKNNK